MILVLFIFSKTLLFTVGDSTFIFYKYDTQRAKSILEGGIYKDRFWLNPDDNQGNSYFVTKRDFKKNGILKVIPILKLSKKFREYDYSKNVLDYYELDPSLYCGLIFKRSLFLDVMFVDFVSNKKEQLVPVASLGDTPVKFHDVLQQKGSFLFYDSSIHSFCFFEDNNLYAWSDKNQQFISYKTLIEDEKFGLDLFRKSIAGHE